MVMFHELMCLISSAPQVHGLGGKKTKERERKEGRKRGRKNGRVLSKWLNGRVGYD